MRLTDTVSDLFDGEVVEEVRRRGTNVVRAARGAPVDVAVPTPRWLVAAGLFAAGLGTGLAVAFAARRLSTPVPDTWQPQPSYPVKDGIVDLTSLAETDGVPSADLDVLTTGSDDRPL